MLHADAAGYGRGYPDTQPVADSYLHAIQRIYYPERGHGIAAEIGDPEAVDYVVQALEEKGDSQRYSHRYYTLSLVPQKQPYAFGLPFHGIAPTLKTEPIFIFIHGNAVPHIRKDAREGLG